MSTPGRYRTAVLPASTDAYGQVRTAATTCTDCGALVLDQNTHDTWHDIATATHLRDGDILILTGDFSTDLEGRQHLNDLLARLDIAHRTLVIGDGLTAQVLPRETLEPGPTERPADLISDTVATTLPLCPDCGHRSRNHSGNYGCVHRDGDGQAMCGCHRTAW